MKNWEDYAKHGDLRSVIDSGDTLGFKNNYINLMQHKILSDNMGDLNGKRVLDLGCGIGRFTKLLQDLGADVIGIDSCNDMLKYNIGKTVCTSTDSLPFEDKYFDVVLSVWTLQYVDIKPLVKTVGEIDRVLKPDGNIYLIEQISDNGYDYVYPRWVSDYENAFNKFSLIYHRPIMLERDKVVGIIRHGIIPSKYFSLILPYHLELNKYLYLNKNEYVDYFMHFKKETL